MDRFSHLMIGICICACICILILFFVTTSVYLWNVGDDKSEFSPPISYRGKVQPERAVGGGAINSGNTSESDDAKLARVESSGSVSGDRPSQNGAAEVRISPFARMTDARKNECWWEIAGSAKRSGEDLMTFTLTIDRLGHLTRKYDCTLEELMHFFREGTNADWWQPEKGGDKKNRR